MEIPLSIHVDNNKEESINIILRLEEKVVDGYVEHHWKTEENNSKAYITISYFFDNNRAINSVIQKTINIVESANEIFTQLWEKYINISSKETIDGVESDNNNDYNDEKQPYDPKLIRIDTRNLSVAQIYDMIKEKEIDLTPDFQRNFVWNSITEKSRLIESMLLRIPLPVFYFSEDTDGILQVVDGMQRLTVISDFMDNKFPLKNLEYLCELNGKYFNKKDNSDKSLPNEYRRRIELTQLVCNIIDPQSPQKAKYDIFKRINTVGKVLNAQEMRNAFSKPCTRELLDKLSKSKHFLNATDNRINPTRMADKEIILRFIAFYLLDNKEIGIEQKEYNGDVDDFLGNTIELLNNAKSKYDDIIINDFNKAMENAFLLFGSKSFRKINFINKALFVSLSRVLWKINTEKIKEELKNKEDMYYQKLLDDMINKNEKYNNALSAGTNQPNKVQTAYEYAQKLLEGLL